jgi:hypothetical protein
VARRGPYGTPWRSRLGNVRRVFPVTYRAATARERLQELTPPKSVKHPGRQAEP